ncbi:G5 domain-containing protein [Candidatus Saccharibacteria bacterium]|nr:G5 domain-containing protein [Candidatus Saccharibacteria bacterium]
MSNTKSKSTRRAFAGITLALLGTVAIAGICFSAAPSTVVKEETTTESIPYNTITVKDSSVEYGKTVVREAGKPGVKTYTYSVTYEKGKEIKRDPVRTEITTEPVDKIIAEGTKILWHCRDVTSYNKNPYDDNECTSSTGEVRLVSDSQAIQLDPTYTPGKSGHSYYNSK